MRLTGADVTEAYQVQVSSKLFLRNPLGEVLLLRRSKLCKRNAGCWDLPGGKRRFCNLPNGLMVPLETATACSFRELEQETGIFSESVCIMGIARAKDDIAYTHVSLCDDGVVRRRNYQVATTIEGPRQLSGEHDAWKWVSQAFLQSYLEDKPDRSAAGYIFPDGELRPVS